MIKPVIYQILVRLFGNKKSTVELNGSAAQNGCGKFNDITTTALVALREFGVSHIWYTGVIEHALLTDFSNYNIANDYPEIVKGKAGSPYAIKDYYDVNPDLANNPEKRMDEFELLIDRTHKAGLKVLIDFVPNHLARNYKSDSKPQQAPADFGDNDNPNINFSTENDYYYLPYQPLKLPIEIYEKSAGTEYRRKPLLYSETPARATGNNCFTNSPSVTDWYETVKLNYGLDFQDPGNPVFAGSTTVWEKMYHIIMFWANKGVDGFRVDMAGMVPVEFWAFLISKVKESYPRIIFIAEIYEEDKYREFIESGNFDYLYDKVGFYDTVRTIIENNAGASSITKIWQKIDVLEKNMVRFLENHDEQRVASRFFAGDPFKAIPGMALAALMNRGPIMLYNGQETGEAADGSSGYSGDDGRTTIFDYWILPNHQKWMNDGKFDGEKLTSLQEKLRSTYALLLKIINNNPVFSNGEFYDLMWVNKTLSEQTEDKLYCFLRHLKKKSALIIINFSPIGYDNLELQIPPDALKLITQTRTIEIENEYTIPQSNEVVNSRIIEEKNTLIFNAPPLSARILVLG